MPARSSTKAHPDLIAKVDAGEVAVSKAAKQVRVGVTTVYPL